MFNREWFTVCTAERDNRDRGYVYARVIARTEKKARLATIAKLEQKGYEFIFVVACFKNRRVKRNEKQEVSLL